MTDDLEVVNTLTRDEQHLMYYIALKENGLIGEYLQPNEVKSLVARGYIEEWQIVTPVLKLSKAGEEWLAAKAKSDIETGNIHICYSEDITS